MEDITSLLSGGEAGTRYDGEHKVLMYVFPEHLVDEKEVWDKKICDPKISFCSGNNDYMINLSLYDVRFSLATALNIKGKLIPTNTPGLKGVTIFMPDGHNYQSEKNIHLYVD